MTHDPKENFGPSTLCHGPGKKDIGSFYILVPISTKKDKNHKKNTKEYKKTSNQTNKFLGIVSHGPYTKLCVTRSMHQKFAFWTKNLLIISTFLV